MLSKLLKHEFRATFRTMLPIITALLLLGPASGIATRILDSEGSGFLADMFSVLILAAFFCGLFAVLIIAFVMMIQRFYKNLLGNEGYFMFTLPASVDELIFSKLIVSTVWFVIAAAVCVLAVFLMLLTGKNASINFNFIPSGISSLIDSVGTCNFIAYALEFILAAAATTFTACLRFYLAMAIGYSFPDKKGLLSVVFYFVIGFVLKLLGAVFGVSVVRTGIFDTIITLDSFNSMISAIHGGMIGMLLGALVVDAILFIPTRYFLKNRLNLA